MIDWLWDLFMLIAAAFGLLLLGIFAVLFAVWWLLLRGRPEVTLALVAFLAILGLVLIASAAGLGVGFVVELAAVFLLILEGLREATKS